MWTRALCRGRCQRCAAERTDRSRQGNPEPLHRTCNDPHCQCRLRWIIQEARGPGKPETKPATEFSSLSTRFSGVYYSCRQRRQLANCEESEVSPAPTNLIFAYFAYFAYFATDVQA